MANLDLIGSKFGKLTVVGFFAKKPAGHQYRCRCDCGGKSIVYSSKLRLGHTKSCGCEKYGNRPSAIESGDVFGRLTAVEATGETKGGSRIWKFLCQCGSEHVAAANAIKFGQIKSCGCLFLEKIRQPRAGKHKMIKTPEYRIWSCMRSRCRGLDPNYGGRGVRVCKRWDSFEAFYADMGPRPSPAHSLDRKKTNGNYTPKNCKWATAKEQAGNRRNNVYVELNGENVPVAVASERLNIPLSTCHWRVKRGLPLYPRV